MNIGEQNAMDRYITGNYGDDQEKDEYDEEAQFELDFDYEDYDDE